MCVVTFLSALQTPYSIRSHETAFNNLNYAKHECQTHPLWIVDECYTKIVFSKSSWRKCVKLLNAHVHIKTLIIIVYLHQEIIDLRIEHWTNDDIEHKKRTMASRQKKTLKHLTIWKRENTIVDKTFHFNLQL